MSATTEFNQTVAKVKQEAAGIVAAATGWEIINDENCWMFTARERSSGAEFQIRLDRGSKYTVSCCWPRDQRNDYYSPESYGHPFNGGEPAVPPVINVSKSRGYEVLVREVERRLLPFAREWWPRMEALANKGNRDEKGKQAALKLIACMLGGTRPQHDSETVYGSGNTRIREIRVNHDGTSMTVKLDYGIPIELLDDMIELFKKED